MSDDAFKIVFMGAPEFAVPALRALHPRHDLRLVVTQPDRPKGRGRALAPPPVKVAALDLGLEVFQPEKLRRRSVRERIAAAGADLFVVAAYGKILSPRMLSVPPLGCVNVHASLLPRYRGAAPIHWAVIRGERQSGITIMLMDRGMDTGPMLAQQALDLTPGETAGSLHDRLAPLGADLLLETLDGLRRGVIEPRSQDDQQATLAPMLAKEDGRVDFSSAAAEVDCRVRGLDPWPGAFTTLDHKPLKLFSSRATAGQGGAPGEVLGADPRGLLVACAEGAVWIRELQLPGRRRIPADALLSGHPINPGTLLGG